MATDMVVQQYPRVGEVFWLELDADEPENAPHPGMVQSFGYNPEDLRFMGTPLTGKFKGRFKLVQQIGYHQPNLGAAEAALEAKYGPTPKGQWMKAFKDAYPEADGKGPVGVADASWVGLDDYDLFPFVDSDGKPRFLRSGNNLLGHWRWLVSVPEGEENDAETEN